MRPLSPTLCKRLRLQLAAEQEAQAEQNLLPAVPGLSAFASSTAEFAEWLQGQLLHGLQVAPQVVVPARKIQLGVRPVAVWGMPERTAYRALVDFVLRNEPPLDRSAQAYLEFVKGPVLYARDIEPPSDGPFAFLTIASSVIKYVVQSDVTAFYEYVDHGVLARELLAKTGDHEAIEAISDLLREAQGRTHGLPQLLEPSDRLSEIYIDVAGRELLRKNWPTWRFNDDFRIAVRSFPEALASIEDLATAARQLGLALSDTKTTTPRFSTYAMEHFDLELDDQLPETLGDPSDLVGDYTEGVGETDTDWAVELLKAAWSPETPPDERDETGLHLSGLKGEDLRRLRRALNRLVAAEVGGLLPEMLKLLVYAPSLTPSISRYVVMAGQTQPESAAVLVDTALEKISLGDWQRMWILRTIDQLALLNSSAPGDLGGRVNWVRDLQHGRHSSYVAAEALLTLAGGGQADPLDVEHGLRERPTVLAPWYLAAAGRLYASGLLDLEQYNAYRNESGAHKSLLRAVAPPTTTPGT